MEKKLVYLDNASTTQMYPEAIEELQKVSREIIGNPSSQHYYGRKAKILLEQAREIIASTINAKPNEIYFTSGGTESLNFCIKGIAKALKKEFNSNIIISSKTEHSATTESLELLIKENFKVFYLNSSPIAKIVYPLEKYEFNSIYNCLATLIHVNNETGAVLDEEIIKYLKSEGAFIHIDAVQSFCKNEIDVSKLPIDALSISSHKIHGPKGVGAVYLRNGTPIESLIVGGSQERQKRGGTENLAGIIAFAKAVQIAFKNLKNNFEYVSKLKKKFVEYIFQIDKEGIRINSEENFSPYILNITFLPEFYKCDVESALIFLDLKGVCASAGSACTSGIFNFSKMLVKAGMTEKEAKQSIRFSFSIFNTFEDIEIAALALEELKKKFRVI